MMKAGRRWQVWLAAVAVAAGGAVGVPPAQAAEGDFWVRGEAVSRVDPDVRRLAVKAAHFEDDRPDRGGVAFEHRSPSGLSRFAGRVTCLARSGDEIRLTGTVRRGRTAAGDVLTGRDFGFTLIVSRPQAFSLPQFADAGTLAPCAGGRPDTVPVTRGGFRVGTRAD